MKKQLGFLFVSTFKTILAEKASIQINIKEFRLKNERGRNPTAE
jgi:hypothetical protein